LKRWVLRAFLKEGRVGDCRMWMGRVFQREGAATEKALSPQVRSLVLLSPYEPGCRLRSSGRALASHSKV